MSSVKEILSNLRRRHTSLNIIDVGCRKGVCLWGLIKLGLISSKDLVVGLDVDLASLKQLKQSLNLDIVLGDAQSLPFRDNVFHFLWSNQVIEHIPDDLKALKNFFRVLRDEGIAKIETVIKGRFAIYWYRGGEGFCLDPSHIREYKSREEIESLISGADLHIKRLRVYRGSLSLASLILQLLVKVGIISYYKAFAHEYPYILRKIKFPMIGYYGVDIIASTMNKNDPQWNRDV